MTDVNNSPGKLQISPELVLDQCLPKSVTDDVYFFCVFQIYDFTAEDLEDMGEIGRGNFGSVNKMLHIKTSTVMAVKVLKLHVLFVPSLAAIFLSRRESVPLSMKKNRSNC